MTQQTYNTQLNSTIDALQGDVTTLNPTTAVSSIDNWRGVLQNAGDPSLTQIADDLGDLRDLLTSDNPSASAIADSLSRLGDRTTSAASSAPSEYQQQLQQLGSLLTQASTLLS